MADQQPPAEGIEDIQTAHVTDGLSASISGDGKHAMLVFKIAGAKLEKIGITCEVEKLPLLRSMVNQLFNQLEQRGGPRMVNVKIAKSIMVGHAEGLRNHVLLTMNEGLPEEETYGMHDQNGMQVADDLTKDIMGRMSEADRRKMMQRKAPLITPARKLITPGY